MKLWDKGYSLNKVIESFTVGDDYIYDMKIIRYDIEASKAHAMMLNKIGILTKNELDKLLFALEDLMILVDENKFVIRPEQEDCHTAIEEFLTEKTGSVGKKIHTARSRNDQVLAAMRLYEKAEVQNIRELITGFITALHHLIEKNPGVVIPGYTHTRKAMPLSLESWLMSFACSMEDNISVLNNAAGIIDNNPLGSVAGFGIPVIKIDREMTTKLLGFAKYFESDIYYQNTRLKTDAILLSALTCIMADLNKFASDLIMFSGDDIGFIKLPKEFCTGSSVMPHKLNPDFLEIIRAVSHEVLSQEFKLKTMGSNLISGYHRDFQLSKRAVINSFDSVKKCLEISTMTTDNLTFDLSILKKLLTDELYTVGKINVYLQQGLSFRDAYRIVAEEFMGKNVEIPS